MNESTASPPTPQHPDTLTPRHPHDVVSLGVHILDVLGRPVTRIPPKQDIDLLQEIRLTVAGTAAGTSVDLAKLGANVLAIGAIGEDLAGNFIVDTMIRCGVDTNGLRRKSAVQTSASMLPVRPNGERPALHVIGANAELGEDDIDLDAIANARHLTSAAHFSCRSSMAPPPPASWSSPARAAFLSHSMSSPSTAPISWRSSSRPFPTSTTSCPASTKPA